MLQYYNVITLYHHCCHQIESRQHPVTIHFSRKTPDDYMTEAFKKICKIHSELPEGLITYHNIIVNIMMS